LVPERQGERLVEELEDGPGAGVLAGQGARAVDAGRVRVERPIEMERAGLERQAWLAGRDRPIPGRAEGRAGARPVARRGGVSFGPREEVARRHPVQG